MFCFVLHFVFGSIDRRKACLDWQNSKICQNGWFLPCFYFLDYLILFYVLFWLGDEPAGGGGNSHAPSCATTAELDLEFWIKYMYQTFNIPSQNALPLPIPMAPKKKKETLVQTYNLPIIWTTIVDIISHIFTRRDSALQQYWIITDKPMSLDQVQGLF